MTASNDCHTVMSKALVIEKKPKKQPKTESSVKSRYLHKNYLCYAHKKQTNKHLSQWNDRELSIPISFLLSHCLVQFLACVFLHTIIWYKQSWTCLYKCPILTHSPCHLHNVQEFMFSAGLNTYLTVRECDRNWELAKQLSFMCYN